MGLGTSRTLIEQTNTLSENTTFRVHLMTVFERLNTNHNRKNTPKKSPPMQAICQVKPFLFLFSRKEIIVVKVVEDWTTTLSNKLTPGQ